MRKTSYKHRQLNAKTRLVLFCAAALIAAVCALPLYTVSASNPSSGTLAPTATAPVSWDGTASGGASSDESTCNEGVNCDSFTLTLDGSPSDWAGKVAHVKISWLAPASDYDLFVHKGTVSGPIVASSAQGTNTSEEVDLDPRSTGTGVFVVHVVYFAATAADQYHGAATVASATGVNPAAQATGIAPRYQNFETPQAILNMGGKGTDAGEPSIGVNWKTNRVLFQSGLTTFRVTFNDASPSSPTAVWEDKSAMTAATSLDPIMFTDHGLDNSNPGPGRTFTAQLAGTGSLTSYTDDDGTTFMPSSGGYPSSGVDHQTIGGGGPFHSPVPTNPVYPNAVYYCGQDIADATCAVSFDGGQTFGAGVPVYNLTQCGGLHGHIKVGSDGTAYLPNKGCGGEQAVVVSEDNGATWNIRNIPGSTPSSSDPSLATSKGNRIYFGYSDGGTKPVVAVSDDQGRSWKNFSDVGASVGIANVAFPRMIAGDNDRAAFSFMGSTTSGNGSDRAFKGVWHLYIATTYDGGLSWHTVDATPNDPIQRNGIHLGGGSPAHRNLLDFMGMDVDRNGRVVVGYADGCTGPACVQAPAGGIGNSYTAIASIARQTGGRGLFQNMDGSATMTTVPGEPYLTVGRDGYATRLTWSQSDNGGSPITSYLIFRRPAGGTFTQLASVSGTQMSYEDATIDPNVTYSYKVTPVNSVGASGGVSEVVSKVIGASCYSLKIISDPLGDQRGGAPNADLDIKKVSGSEPYAFGTRQLVFRMNVADPALKPNRQYRVIWNYPFKAPEIPDAKFTGTYYVGMNTDANGNRTFEYGTVTTAEAVPANTSQPNKIGTTTGKYDPNTGIITIRIDPSKIGDPKPGDLVGKIVGRTFAGNGNDTVLGTSAIDTTSIIGSLDPYTAASYRLVGNLNVPCYGAP